MPAADTPAGPAAGPDQVRADWLARLGQLVDQIEAWGRALDWSTRRIERKIRDAEIGTYPACGLVLQKDFARALLEPIARSAPGAEGVVDLYLMPGLDDIATLFFYNGGWHIHYAFPDQVTVATVAEGTARPLSKEALQLVLDGMSHHGE